MLKIATARRQNQLSSRAAQCKEATADPIRIDGWMGSAILLDLYEECTIVTQLPPIPW